MSYLLETLLTLILGWLTLSLVMGSLTWAVTKFLRLYCPHWWQENICLEIYDFDI